ncbi:uncharacterized protein N7500_001704 [Penicillium coprophilum]|uniref:uncharacterized protein n=1 Tax=Penicillium coprophilum TaxID=36646 RepID=UPI002390020C|nr:uncharacterized protein N7500_001704 [Penicillium coprophilum]KAJ5173773.1 hypothetical protein N7500_001704 [Penicillium coprophilum]
MTYDTITVAYTRNNAPRAQNSLSSAVGDILVSWKDIESNYLKNIFPDENSSLGNLTFLIEDSKMNFVPNTLDATIMVAEVQYLLNGQLMPTT